ncbi:hypothetical protein Tco_1245936 [Tanacetum coccineum]
MEILLEPTSIKLLVDEDGDTGMGDSTGVSVSLGGEISSRRKKSREYWELLPKEILGAITQRDTGSYYPKRDWDVLWENGGNLGTSLDPPWSDLELHLSGDEFLSKVEGDGEVRVMTRGFGDLVAKLGDKVVMEVLVRCWSDGDVVPTSVPVKWLSFTNRNSDEAQTSEHG